MAGMLMVDPRKKPVKNMERSGIDGLTGMGFHTKKHFIDVRAKMLHYLESQEQMEYDGNRLHPQMPPRQPVPPVAVNGRKSPNARAKALTPVPPRRQVVHPGFATPQMDRRQRRASPRPPVR